MTLGKSSIYIIAFLAGVQALGFTMIYFIVFGGICSSLVSQVFLDNGQNFWSSQLFWDLVLFASLMPIILKKTLREVKLIADLHLGAVMLFILCMLIQRFTEGRTYNIDAPGPYNYWHFEWTMDDVTNFAILLCSYNFSFIEFPVYYSLGPDRSPKIIESSTRIALFFTSGIYISTALLAIYLFGSGIKPNCLENVADEGISFQSVFIRVPFAVVVACHVPYIFFFGKEGICIIVDELLN